MVYNVLKALHIAFVVCWYAGLFYLPRIFVNLAMVPADSGAERDRLLLMAGKLYRFMTPLGILAVIFGAWMWLGFGVQGAWIHAKLTLVLVLVLYHAYCGRLLTDFATGSNRRSHRWFRWFNELPVLILFAVVFLAVLKPF
ncbi:CopD family protein [Azospira inquinata]|uniref:Protoporphyrinogen IX oxidase n=1 Tax=Azospira inquinata TaxID=2785627 RepID=A0A975XVQ6_9RHOO|nr:CopD family protein [Azospira inquinata]QWT47270.1 CopD family protein [Azospira inquinata]QWT50103.1 CopD family protein [Azospira inquinata]